jgi:hypothetical protein
MVRRLDRKPNGVQVMTKTTLPDSGETRKCQPSIMALQQEGKSRIRSASLRRAFTRLDLRDPLCWIPSLRALSFVFAWAGRFAG